MIKYIKKFKYWKYYRQIGKILDDVNDLGLTGKQTSVLLTIREMVRMRGNSVC